MFPSSSSANLVPLSEQGWLVVLWVTVGLAVLWVVGVLVVHRRTARTIRDLVALP